MLPNNSIKIFSFFFNFRNIFPDQVVLPNSYKLFVMASGFDDEDSDRKNSKKKVNIFDDDVSLFIHILNYIFYCFRFLNFIFDFLILSFKMHTPEPCLWSIYNIFYVIVELKYLKSLFLTLMLDSFFQEPLNNKITLENSFLSIM